MVAGLNAGSAYVSVKPDMRGFSSGVQRGVTGRLGTLAKVGALAGGALAAGFAAKGVKGFLEFDDAMTKSLAIMGEVSGPMRKQMETAAREVGKTTQFSATQAAESYFFLASAGMSAKQAVAAMPAVAKFAAAGNFDLATATDLATDAQSALGLAVKDPAQNLTNLTRVTDVFVKANTLANTSVEQISQAMTNRAGAAMRALNIDIEEGSAVLAAFADQGIKGQVAGNQFAIVLRDLQTQALKNGEEFKKAGVEVYDANGNFKNMGDIIGGLEGHLDGLSSKQQKAALQTLGFSDRSMAAMQALLGTSDAIKGYEKELRNAGGTTERVAAKQLESFRAKLDIIKSRVADVGLSVGKVLVNALFAAAEKARRLAGFVEDNSTAFRVLGGLVVAGTAAWVAYRVTVAASTAVTKIHTLWTTRQTVAQKLLNRALLMNPLGIVIAALAALAVGLVFAYKKSETFRKIVDGAWTGIRRAVSFAWDKVIKPILTAWHAYMTKVLFPVIRFLWNNVVKPVFGGVSATVKAAWNNGIKPVFQALGSFIREKVAPAFRKGVDMIGNAWERIKDLAKKPVNFVINTVYNNGIRKAFNKVAGFLGSKIQLPQMAAVGGAGGSAPRPNTAMAFGGAGGGMGGPVDWVKGLGSKSAKWVQGKFGGMVDGLIGRVGKSPFAQLMGGAARKLADMASDWITDKFRKSATGPMGTKGVVLPKGRYSIGMPYLGYPGHYGADYPAATGTPVHSLTHGRVSKAVTMAGSYGKHVFIDGPGGVQTRYAHLSAYNVRAGQQIRSGQMLGRVGSTGNSTGPHLHFEYRKNRVSINPASLGVFDRGGLLRSGGMAVNLSGRNERVLDPRMTVAFERFTSSVLANQHRGRPVGGVAQRDGGRPIEITANFPATSTPQAAYDAFGGRVIAALSAGGI